MEDNIFHIDIQKYFKRFGVSNMLKISLVLLNNEVTKESTYFNGRSYCLNDTVKDVGFFEFK